MSAGFGTLVHEMGLLKERRAEGFVTGRVQGVHYRSFSQDAALALGLSGWVRNLFDGRVQFVIEGREGSIARFLQWCWKGSPSARVDDVSITFSRPLGEERGFEIRPIADLRTPEIPMPALDVDPEPAGGRC